MGHEVKCSTEHLPVFTYSSFQSSPTRPQSPTHPRCPFMRSVASGLTSRLKQQRYLHFRFPLSEPPARAGASGSAPASNDGRVDGPPRPAGEEGAGSNGGGSGARPPGANVHVVVFQETCPTFRLLYARTRLKGTPSGILRGPSIIRLS